MPAPKAEGHQAQSVARALKDKGLAHLRARTYGSLTSVVSSNVAIGGHFKSSQRKGRDGWKLLLGVRGFQVRGSGAPTAGPEFEDMGVVEEAVEGCGDGSGVAEELAPVFHGAV
jgi:hypothetical protein